MAKAKQVEGISPEGGADAARNALGSRLRERRGVRTQAEVAEAVGVDRSLYSRWETGDRAPSVDQWRALAALFGCKLSEVMPRNQYPLAPTDPDERAEFFDARNRGIRNMGKDDDGS